MDVQRYISSGIIESYVVGSASVQEAQELRAAMAQYPEVKAAVEACERDMDGYLEMVATAQAKPVPTELRSRIFRLIEDDTTDSTLQTVVTDEPRYIYDESPENTGGGASVRKLRFWQIGTAAAVVLFLASAAANVFYLNQYNEYKDKYVALLEDNHSLQAQNELFQARFQESDRMLAMVKNPGTRMVKMGDVSKSHPERQATVFWNAASQEVMISINNLPEPQADQQYQLWAIIDGKPVDAGVFEMGDLSKNLQKMKAVSGDAQMFAVTLEKKGGSPTPTLTQMYVAGKVTGS
ncbi:anti-sigma factor [Chitinophaga sedimenti]|uniref:anti-sigma factor n=1 Tax=Chitinophaga sedimenti TaxID=2033606 RepID=UPI0020057057|nr:anti-sigma factor [Chitinophaga sedimenti]MCK7560154.1 anti-sigma factor [Chitinophaga sedimenti]